MKINAQHSIYFIGIGGIGMSALARYAVAMGATVLGYDKTPTKLTQQLEELGINITYTDSIEHIPSDCSFVVYTPAIPANQQQLAYCKASGIALYKRSELLGLITQNSNCLAVAGTHGKTSTSSTLSWLMSQTKANCNAFIGGISKNFNSNIHLESASNNTVVEADEFDRSFLKLNINTLIITSVDADHLDIYETPEAFEAAFIELANKVENNILLHYSLESFAQKLAPKASVYFYGGPKSSSSFSIEALAVNQGYYSFVVVHPNGKNLGEYTLKIPGQHNLENALAAIAAAYLNGASTAELQTALAVYSGVERRFDVQFNNGSTVYIDDYAHHPSEINALLNAVNLFYPNTKKVGLFQPHLFSRTRDFFTGFASSLSRLDELLLLEIYPARELPISGITSSKLLEKITCPSKKVVQLNTALDYLQPQENTTYLTIGAGDINTLVEPLKDLLNAKLVTA